MPRDNFVRHYAPKNYEQINAIEGCYTPSMVKSFNNEIFWIWERALFQRAASVIDFENLPEKWEGTVKDFFIYCLFRNGFVGVMDLDLYGLTFQPGTISGIDIYYQPTNFIFSNPVLRNTFTDKYPEGLVIGENCELIKLTPDFMGIWDVISMYAEKIAVLDNALNMSLINNKFAFMLAAKNKQASEAFKKMIDKVNSGEPAVIYDMKLANDSQDKSEPWQLWARDHMKENYLTTMQLADLNTILHNFDKEVGIPTIPVEKKERMISDEANSTVIDAISRSEIWLKSLESSLKIVNDKYGLNIKAVRHYREEVTEDAVENNIDGDV